jgi:hypothetical protein
MHRVLLGVPPGMVADHINGNGLDNRRENLRVVTKQENGWNRGAPSTNKSGHKGVHWDKERQQWMVTAKVPGGTSIYLGRYDRIEDAAAASNAWRAAHYPTSPEARQ